MSKSVKILFGGKSGVFSKQFGVITLNISGSTVYITSHDLYKGKTTNSARFTALVFIFRSNSQ